MIGMQEGDYEGEINKLQEELIERQAEVREKKERLESDNLNLKEAFDELHIRYKKKNKKKKILLSEVQSLQADYQLN